MSSPDTQPRWRRHVSALLPVVLAGTGNLLNHWVNDAFNDMALVALVSGAVAWAWRLNAMRERHVATLIKQTENEKAQASVQKRQQAATIASMAKGLVQLNALMVGHVGAIKEMTAGIERDSMNDSLVDGHLQRLAQSVEESGTSLLQMVAINNEVRDNIHVLMTSVEETSASLEDMTLSSQEVARNIEELSTAAEETAASMNEMDISIRHVESNATETSRLSETVSHDAEIGVTAITQTILGIDRIKESSRVAADVIGNLGQKISAIGNILNVIDDVAEQTNLLALNAAIIAAQAGEHGRGFAVVADEIKALAERTGASTKEIADLIRTIQDESKRAIGVMGQGVDNVEEGVRLGHNAEDALRKIVDSARRCTLMIQAIALATVEQAKGSQQVNNAIGRIAETVQQIAHATSEQAKGSGHIMQSAERMRAITQGVTRSASEQSKGGSQITHTIETIRASTEALGVLHRGKQESELSVRMQVQQALDAGSQTLVLFKDLESLLDTDSESGSQAAAASYQGRQQGH